MKTRGIVFALEWLLANALVWKVLDDSRSFYAVPWALWNVIFGIFLFKLFTSPDDDSGGVRPIGPAVGAFCFVLTSIRVDDGDGGDGYERSRHRTGLSGMGIPGCLICLLGFAVIGISSDALGDEWRDAPPPESGTDDDNRDGENSDGGVAVGEASNLLGSSSTTRQHLVTDGPYRIVRHPIYLGLLLEAFGSNVVGGFSSRIAVAALVAVTLAYVVQLNKEEEELNKLSGGAYDRDYKRKTRYKLVPFVY